MCATNMQQNLRPRKTVASWLEVCSHLPLNFLCYFSLFLLCRLLASFSPYVCLQMWNPMILPCLLLSADTILSCFIFSSGHTFVSLLSLFTCFRYCWFPFSLTTFVVPLSFFLHPPPQGDCTNRCCLQWATSKIYEERTFLFRWRREPREAARGWSLFSMCLCASVSYARSSVTCQLVSVDFRPLRCFVVGVCSVAC